MRVGLGVFTIISMAGAPAFAADAIPTAEDPDRFLISQAPAGAGGEVATAAGKDQVGSKKQAAVAGNLYAVIAPVYGKPEDDVITFLRIFQGGSSTATVSVKVVGTPSGNDYGTASLQIPPRASKQFSTTDIMDAAGISFPNEDFTFYLQSNEITAGYQHVMFSQNTGFFENASLCRYMLNQTVGSVVDSVVLTNIHTTNLTNWAGGYPSQVEFHNYWNTAITYRITVIEAETGTARGEFNFPAQPNSSYVLTASYIEQQAGWTSSGGSSGQNHMNIVVTDPSDAPPAVVLGHTIENTRQTGTGINMTAMCAINPPDEDGDGGFGGGGIEY